MASLVEGFYRRTSPEISDPKLEEVDLESDNESEMYHSSDEAIESSLHDVVEDVIRAEDRGVIQNGYSSVENGKLNAADDRGLAQNGHPSLPNEKLKASPQMDPGPSDENDCSASPSRPDASVMRSDDLVVAMQEEQRSVPQTEANQETFVTDQGLGAAAVNPVNLMVEQTEMDRRAVAKMDLEDLKLSQHLTGTGLKPEAHQPSNSEGLDLDTESNAMAVAPNEGAALQTEDYQQRVSSEDGAGTATRSVGSAVKTTLAQTGAASRRQSGNANGSNGSLPVAADLAGRQSSEQGLGETPSQPRLSEQGLGQTPSQPRLSEQGFGETPSQPRFSEQGLGETPSQTPTPGGAAEQQVPAEVADTGRIPFFIITSTGRKAASPRLSNETIDFPGARITADKFVGLRYVREGSKAESASPGARLLEAIQDFPSMTVAAAERTVTSILSVLPSPRRSSGGEDKAAAGSAHPPEAIVASRSQAASVMSDAATAGSEEPASASGSAERRRSSDSPEMHVWEIIWKDHSKHTQDRPGGTLQQVQFETTKAGFRFIQRIIDIWSLEATETSAMTEAAKAALKAQDLLDDTGTDYPFSKPETTAAPASTFPRSLFGKARVAANGASNQAEPLSRAASEDLQASGADVERTKSGLSAVERTESGVSTADSVESASSVRSGASASSVAIALVASGTRNGYGGGLQHVMIPESETVAGIPPPEKPGAPLVEGRYLPNMIPHSHVLQQPHIRALAAALPVRFRLSSWVLLYSTWRDGISLQTMYRKAAKKGPCIMVVLDTKHNVFGCYTSESWKVHPRYYGSGECFVFQLYPEMRIYRWTRDNSYFMFGTPDSIHIGGGSHFALSVSGDLLSGCTGSCETFGNGPLVKPDEYGILHVELWGFQ